MYVLTLRTCCTLALVPSHLLLTKFSVPAGAEMKESIEMYYWQLHPFSLLNTLGIQVDEMRLSEIVEENDKSVRIKRKAVDGEFERTKENVFDDAYLSFDFNLRHGILFTNSEPLSNSTKAALHDWLELLQKSLPPVWKIHKVINAVLGDFETATRDEEQLFRILDQFPAPTQKWSKSCTKGMPGMGYTCGLWELFHIMAVSKELSRCP
jgi:hypothetical protein